MNLSETGEEQKNGLSKRLLFFDKQLLRYREAASYLGICESTLRRLKRDGQIKFVPIGVRGVRFRRSHLDHWAEKREIG